MNSRMRVGEGEDRGAQERNKEISTINENYRDQSMAKKSRDGGFRLEMEVCNSLSRLVWEVVTKARF